MEDATEIKSCFALALASALLLSGCGGGDSTEDSGPGPYPPGPTPGLLKITTENAARILFKTYQAHDRRVRREPLERNPRQYVEGRCPECKTGSVEVFFDDNDRDGGLSTGDEVRARYHQCVYDSRYGYGEVFLDGGLSFTSIDVNSERDQWYATRYTQTQYKDDFTGLMDGVEFAFGYSAQIVWSDEPGVPKAARIILGAIIDTFLDGESVLISGPITGGSIEEVFSESDDGYQFAIGEGVQTFGAIQETDNPNGIVFGVATVTPFQGRRSLNGGYPTGGAMRVKGIFVREDGNADPATATLIADGDGGDVVVEIDKNADGVSDVSMPTSWHALSMLE